MVKLNRKNRICTQSPPFNCDRNVPCCMEDESGKGKPPKKPKGSLEKTLETKGIINTDPVRFCIKNPAVKEDFDSFVHENKDDIAVIYLVTSKGVKKRIDLKDNSYSVLFYDGERMIRPILATKPSSTRDAAIRFALKKAEARRQKMRKQPAKLHRKREKKEQTDLG